MDFIICFVETDGKLPMIGKNVACTYPSSSMDHSIHVEQYTQPYYNKS